MKYRISFRAANSDLPERWVVERVLNDGDAYTLSSYREHGPAIAVLSLIASSLEVEKGATVEFDKWVLNAETE